jgi:transcriptional regulator with XRE-family HTH domain
MEKKTSTPKKQKKEAGAGSLKSLKKEIGARFKLFRQDKKKAQNELATELLVHQSTITNIEHGATFPKVNYLHYFYEKYGVNLNWLIAGHGNQYMLGEDFLIASKIMSSRPEYEESIKHNYLELSKLMQIPVIEQVMFAKLSECKILFKEHVQEFLKKQEEEKHQTEKKASQIKLQR